MHLVGLHIYYLSLLLIQKAHYYVHKSLPLLLYTARSNQSAKYVIQFNLILQSGSLAQWFSQSKSAEISELHLMMKRLQHYVELKIGGFYTGHPVVFKYTCIEEIGRITFCTRIYCTCKGSYMFRLYKFNLHQAWYNTLNKKIIKQVISVLISLILVVFLFQVLHPAWWWLHTYSRNI